MRSEILKSTRRLCRIWLAHESSTGWMKGSRPMMPCQVRCIQAPVCCPTGAESLLTPRAQQAASIPTGITMFNEASKSEGRLIKLAQQSLALMWCCEGAFQISHLNVESAGQLGPGLTAGHRCLSPSCHRQPKQRSRSSLECGCKACSTSAHRSCPPRGPCCSLDCHSHADCAHV